MEKKRRLDGDPVWGDGVESVESDRLRLLSLALFIVDPFIVYLRSRSCIAIVRTVNEVGHH